MKPEEAVMPDIDDKAGPEPEKREPERPAAPAGKRRRRSKGAGGGMTVAEAGRKGGQAVRDKYGPGFSNRSARRAGKR